MSSRSEIIEAVKEYKLISIVRGVEKNKALEIADALYQGGVKLIEVTFNTEGAVEMIEAINKEFGDKMYVGAGTVLDSETAKQAINAGAEYILSPSLNENMVNTCNRYGKVAVPGVATPTEAVEAMQVGADLIKFFPAAASGANYLKSVRGPLDHVEIIAVGGVSIDNALDFLDAGAVGLGVGSSLVKNELIEAGNFEGIKQNASNFINLIENN